jgi:hypothetical protein
MWILNFGVDKFFILIMTLYLEWKNI